LSELGDVLVVTVRKSFWASSEAEQWPRRLYARVYRGHSSALMNAVPVFVRALLSIWLRPPRIVLLGSVERTVPWFIRARRFGLLRKARLVVTNQLNLMPAELEYVDRVIVYASAQATKLGEKGVFLPLPADGDFEEARRAAEPGDYAFAGGGAGRDFVTLVDAVRGAPVRVEIAMFAPEIPGPVPANVRTSGPMPLQNFLARMAGANIVVIPLSDAASPHGQTTLVQALALGKPIVATRSLGVVDYVENRREGLLVDARDPIALRDAVLRLFGDEDLRMTCAAHAAKRGASLSYCAHASSLAQICRALCGD